MECLYIFNENNTLYYSTTSNKDNSFLRIEKIDDKYRIYTSKEIRKEIFDDHMFLDKIDKFLDKKVLDLLNFKPYKLNILRNNSRVYMCNK